MQEETSMRRLIIAASVVVVVMISAIALVVINADDTATASQTDATQPETEEPLPEFMEQRLQDLVERGFITQEQLDEMEGWFHWRGPQNRELPEDHDPERFRERFRGHPPWNGELPDGFDFEHFMGPESGPHHFGFLGGNEDLTDLLGVTPEELMDALAEGTPLIDIIEDADAFVDSVVESVEDALNEAVESGLLTQAEANELIAEARSQAQAFLNGEGFHGREFLGGHGSGGFHSFGHFDPHHREHADAATAGYSA